MALTLPEPNPETEKTKIVANKATINEYHVLRSVDQGVAKSYMIFSLAYGNDTDTPDPDFPTTKLFSTISIAQNYISTSWENLYIQLMTAVTNNVNPSVTLERVNLVLGTMKAADEANEAAILSLVELLQDAEIKALPSEEISKLE